MKPFAVELIKSWGRSRFKRSAQIELVLEAITEKYPEVEVNRTYIPGTDKIRMLILYIPKASTEAVEKILGEGHCVLLPLCTCH